MKASRAFFSEVNTRFPTMPFTLRAGDEKAWRMGVVECVKHDLFIEYPVLYEKPEEFVAQYKFTGERQTRGTTCGRFATPRPLAAFPSDTLRSASSLTPHYCSHSIVRGDAL